MNNTKFPSILLPKKIMVAMAISLATVIVIGTITTISFMSENRYSERIPLYPNSASILPIEPRTIEGKIHADGFGIKFDDATAYITIQDTSLQDAPSILLQRITLNDVSYDSSLPDNGISFSIPIYFEVIDGPSYTISASIDTNNNGRQDQGDFITTTSYPILNRGFGDYVNLVLEKIQ